MRTVVSLTGMFFLLLLTGCPGSKKTTPPKDRGKRVEPRRGAPSRTAPGKARTRTAGRAASGKEQSAPKDAQAKRNVPRKKPGKPTLVISWFPSPEALPLQVMADKKLLQKYAKKFNAKVRLKKFSDYIGSVHAYNTQKVQGCVMDSLNVLRSSVRGASSMFALPLSSSRGSFNLVLRRGVSRRRFLKMPMFLEQYGLGHFLVSRYLSRRRKRLPRLNLVNISVKDAGEAFLSDKNIKVAVTTREYALRIRKKRLGRILFDSSKDPHALQFGLVLRYELTKSNPGALKAFAKAWSEAVSLLQSRKTRSATLASLAKSRKTTISKLVDQMRGWTYHGDLRKSKAYLVSASFQSSMKRARQFLFKQRMLSGLPTPSSLGFVVDGKVPGGSMISRLVFDPALLP